MKLTAQVKLLPTKEDHAYLKYTLEQANAACNYISEYAWANKVFNHFALHKALYRAVRAQFGLSAQLVVRCLGKVADGYKTDAKHQRVFKAHGAIPYDARILSWQTDKRRVSIWTVGQRLTIPYTCGEQQVELLKHQQGESDLVYQRGQWYLLATCAVADPTPDEVDGYLGVDRGVVNLATDSDGGQYQGTEVEQKRQWYTRRRRNLRKRGTKSANRLLKKIGDKQARYQKDVNHCIAKQLVQTAKRTKRGIALEDLTGITLRTRVRHEDRAARGNWAFAQLEFFIVYKALRAGVPITFVDPAYTSQRCSVCGHTDKANRRTQSQFLCVNCGHTAHADVNAAINIASLAAVIQPKVSNGRKAKKPRVRGTGTSPRL